MIRLRPVAAATLLSLVAYMAAPAAVAADLVVFAAASLKEALDEAKSAYVRQTGGEVMGVALSKVLRGNSCYQADLFNAVHAASESM